MGAEPLLAVDGLGARVGARWLVDDVSFTARAGEITAIIGPNGAGKTTLLESLVGLRAPDRGVVRVGGRRLERFSDRARAFAFLPDAGELPPETIVRTLVDHALACGPRPADVVTALRQRLGVDALLGAPAGVLSRGERQRIALFCALALARPIVVLDEPLTALDPLQTRSALATMRAIAAAGAAVVASVHQLADAERLADRVLLLAAGRRVAFGDLAAVRAEARVPGGSLEDAFIALLERGPGAA